MKTQLDMLIHERAPWLSRNDLPVRLARPALHRVLRYAETLALAEEMRKWPANAILGRMADRVALHVHTEGLCHLPSRGPALVVANHPTGIADGLILWHVLARRRPDLLFFANSDILRLFPQMSDVIIPVEWRHARRCHAKSRATWTAARQAARSGRMAVLFPSGRLAARRGLALVERPWMTSAAAMARKLNLPIVPIHIRARNSALFYTFDKLHPSLRDITLFHETLNKDQQRYRVTIGRPIPAETLDPDSATATAMLRQVVLSLGDTHFAPRPFTPHRSRPVSAH